MYVNFEFVLFTKGQKILPEGELNPEAITNNQRNTAYFLDTSQNKELAKEEPKGCSAAGG